MFRRLFGATCPLWDIFLLFWGQIMRFFGPMAKFFTLYH